MPRDVTATAAIDDLIERGMKALHELDPIMRNTFTDDPAKLAGWLSASRVERSARRGKTETANTVGDSSPTGGGAQPSGSA